MQELPQRRSSPGRHQSRFSKCVKVKPEKKRWLEENRDTKTTAGFLDKIINHYKQHHAETISASPKVTGEATQ